MSSGVTNSSTPTTADGRATGTTASPARPVATASRAPSPDPPVVVPKKRTTSQAGLTRWSRCLPVKTLMNIAAKPTRYPTTPTMTGTASPVVRFSPATTAPGCPSR
jgi:hypothetical protein